jgi:ribosomal-protein-alanine N-acetyltransferase
MVDLFDFQDFPRLETPRLEMRQLEESDASALFWYYCDTEMMKYLFFNPHKSVEDTKSFIRYMTKLYLEKDSIRWGIQAKETGKLIGTAGLHFWKREIRCAEVGYHIGRSYWGNGFATEVLGAMVDFGFKSMNLNCIEGYHNSGNGASGRVMEKLGFTKEGVLRERIVKDNQFVDRVCYSILRREYFHE